MTPKVIENIADSPRRVRIMFRAALVILLAAGCYNWMIEPQLNCLFAARQRQEWDQKKSDELRRIRMSVLELKKKISQMEEQSEQFQKVLFEPGMVRDFFCGLEALAQQSGCRVESLAFEKTDDRKTAKQSHDSVVEVVQASVTAIGGYGAFIQFFDKIGQTPQKITVQEMRFEPVEQGRSALRCGIVIRVYVSKESAQEKPQDI